MTVRKEREGRWRVEVIRRLPDGRKERARRWCARRDLALQVEAELRAERKDTAPSPTTTATKEAPTLSSMWTDFAEFQTSSANKRPWRPRTAVEAAEEFRRHVEPWLGAVRVDQITSKHVDNLAIDLQRGRRPDGTRARPMRENSIANALQLVRRMLRIARRWGHAVPEIEINAAKGRSSKLEDHQWLTPTEAAALVQAADPAWRAVVLVALRSGLRRGELQALRWRDVETDGRRLHVRRSWDCRLGAYGPTKSGKTRVVPLPWDAAEVLAGMERGKPDVLVFGVQGEPFHRNALDRALTRAAKRADIGKHVHAHMCRHSWASHAIMRGVPTKVVQAWAGWASETMLDRYLHLAPVEVDHYADRIAPVRPLRVVDEGSGASAGATGGATDAGPKVKTASEG